ESRYVEMMNRATDLRRRSRAARAEGDEAEARRLRERADRLEDEVAEMTTKERRGEGGMKKVRDLRWIRRPRGDVLRSPDGRFTLTGGVGGRGGGIGRYAISDKEEGRTYRARTLEEVREIIRELRGEG